MAPFNLPSDYPRIRRVRSFQELLTTPLTGGVNALCWQRALHGDFGEVVELLAVGQGITTLDEERLKTLSVSAAGKAAVDLLLEDQRLLRDQGLSPVLECVQGYAREEHPGPVPTDVYSFHVDSATAATDTWLCTYSGPPSEGLRNDQAQRRVDVPETRAELLRLFGGEDNADFREYLSENCYDLHYVPVPQARPFSFGVGNLWRIAVEYPGNPVPPCIHRAPATVPGRPPRLLLIS
ncbi:MAG: hypothetical protein HZA54_12615 [Planctomycetes bacterium]|nr:hypothetical protein [Planctomycetota bacterium]